MTLSRGGDCSSVGSFTLIAVAVPDDPGGRTLAIIFHSPPFKSCWGGDGPCSMAPCLLVSSEFVLVMGNSADGGLAENTMLYKFSSHVKAVRILDRYHIDKSHFFILTCGYRFSFVSTGSPNWHRCSSTQTTNDFLRSVITHPHLVSKHKV